jgi:hypothetical protein
MQMDEFSLEDILSNDPLDILAEAKPKAKLINEDDRLIVSFEEINSFIESNGHEPQKSANMSERTLYSRLQGIKDNPEKIEYLKPYDRFNLLKLVEINSIDDILNDDAFGLLRDDANDIFTLKHVPNNFASERSKADKVASREICKNFEEFEYLLKEYQKDLKEEKRRLIPSIESQLREGMFCVLDGILLYIDKIFQPIRGNSNKLNRRTILIFENGTQSNMLLRSLGKRLRDSGKMVTDLNENLINEEDNKSGYIYILESKSQDEKISTIKNLYKIGYSTSEVKDRIKNAINEPTYLMAPVRIVAVYETYNMNTQKFEQLMHKFFGKVCLNIDIFGNDNKRYTPREWFIVPLEIIERVVELIISGDIIGYRYDEKNEELIF